MSTFLYGIIAVCLWLRHSRRRVPLPLVVHWPLSLPGRFPSSNFPPPPPPCPASPSAIQTCSSVSPASLSHRPPLTAPLQSCNFNQDYSCIAVGHKKGYTILNCDPFGKVHSNSTSLSLGRSAQYAVEADGCTR